MALTENRASTRSGDPMCLIRWPRASPHGVGGSSSPHTPTSQAALATSTLCCKLSGPLPRSPACARAGMLHFQNESLGPVAQTDVALTRGHERPLLQALCIPAQYHLLHVHEYSSGPVMAKTWRAGNA